MLELLELRYAAPEWAFFARIAGGTARIADGLAMNLWTTRGQEIHGCEVKVARGDWLQELRNPRKQEEGLFKYCDRFYLVAPKDVVQKEELPPTWGWLAPNGSRLRKQKDAPQLTPVAVDRMFMTRLLVRSLKIEEGKRFEERQRLKGSADYQRGLKDGQERATSVADNWRKNAEALRLRIDQFEEASGINLAYGGDPPQIGKIVRFMLQEHHRLWALTSLRNAQEQINKNLEDLAAVIGAIEEYGSVPRLLQKASSA